MVMSLVYVPLSHVNLFWGSYDSCYSHSVAYLTAYMQILVYF